ncbi:hypothetical protein BDK51DRAFT_49941 [Blyttiomyces helicus]|uniref:Uncharacterized protein n=1 Tax=Blyttiomyces helicus TaxID=388810 RepID=A0A4P9VWD0_9FUNG|nr:hypothetical protein BDK51DRAFT_49941 [Blyttiomyces helicus]|eukprot:RKO83155.1 hypothetical protein BDK51DRAFT_49941 [Blyttiomyces helicus]
MRVAPLRKEREEGKNASLRLMNIDTRQANKKTQLRELTPHPLGFRTAARRRRALVLATWAKQRLHRGPARVSFTAWRSLTLDAPANDFSAIEGEQVDDVTSPRSTTVRGPSRFSDLEPGRTPLKASLVFDGISIALNLLQFLVAVCTGSYIRAVERRAWTHCARRIDRFRLCLDEPGLQYGGVEGSTAAYIIGPSSATTAPSSSTAAKSSNTAPR